MKQQEIYFTPYGNESDHSAIESILRKKCAELGCSMSYYRKFKNGHVPLWRECKIKGKLPELYKVCEDIDGQINYFHVKSCVEQISCQVLLETAGRRPEEIIPVMVARIKAYLSKEEWSLMGNSIEKWVDFFVKSGYMTVLE